MLARNGINFMHHDEGVGAITRNTRDGFFEERACGLTCASNFSPFSFCHILFSI